MESIEELEAVEDTPAPEELEPGEGEIPIEDLEYTYEETPIEKAEPLRELKPSQEAIPVDASLPIEAKPSEKKGIIAVVELLKHLKGLAAELPEKERVSFSEGKLPTNLESVIDSLQNLTIIKE